MPAHRGSSQRPYSKGFTRTAQLVQPQIRKASETRGFAAHRLLTQWPEIVGEDVARIARPVEVTYGRGFGATLCLLTTGAQAPMLEMRKEELRARVNGIYGYNAIARIRITQTAASGFAEGQADFTPKRAASKPAVPDARVTRDAQDVAAGVSDEGLRLALERLACNVFTKHRK